MATAARSALLSSARRLSSGRPAAERCATHAVTAPARQFRTGAAAPPRRLPGNAPRPQGLRPYPLAAALFRHVKEPFVHFNDGLQTDDQISQQLDKVLSELDTLAIRVEKAGRSGSSSKTGVGSVADGIQFRLGRLADAPELQLSTVDADPERIEKLLNGMAARLESTADTVSAPSTQGTMTELDLSSVLKKRKKKMNKHKYKKRLKLTRALRKSLNK